MRIFIGCSSAFYDRLEPLAQALVTQGHTVVLPNSFGEPEKEPALKQKGGKEYEQWKAASLTLQMQQVQSCDALLVLNLEKDKQPNYIGGATFLEMYKAYELGRKIFLYNPIPDGILKDEIVGMAPVVIGGDLEKIQ